MEATGMFLLKQQAYQTNKHKYMYKLWCKQLNKNYPKTPQGKNT